MHAVQVAESKEFVQSGTTELVTAKRYFKSSRRLLSSAIVLLIIIAVVIAVVIVLSIAPLDPLIAAWRHFQALS